MLTKEGFQIDDGMFGKDDDKIGDAECDQNLHGARRAEFAGYKNTQNAVRRRFGLCGGKSIVDDHLLASCKIQTEIGCNQR